MYTIGIDLGGTNIVASVVDDEYRLSVHQKLLQMHQEVLMKFLMIFPRFAKKQLKQQT